MQWNEASMETEITWSEFPNRGRAIVEQIIASKERNKSKRAGLWESQVNHLSKVIWDRKILTEFTRSITSTRIGKPVLMMDVKSPKTSTLADGLIKRSIYVRWNRIKKHAQRWRRLLMEEKEDFEWSKANQKHK